MTKTTHLSLGQSTNICYQKAHLHSSRGAAGTDTPSGSDEVPWDLRKIMTEGRDKISCFGRSSPVQKARTGNSNLNPQAGMWSYNFILYIDFRWWNLSTKNLSGFSCDLPPANLGKVLYYNEVYNPHQKTKHSIHYVRNKWHFHCSITVTIGTGVVCINRFVHTVKL